MLKRNSNFNSDSFSNSPNQTVNLSNKYLNDKHVSNITSQYDLFAIKAIILSHNNLEGQLMLWSTLNQFANLKILNLSHNNIKLCYLTYVPVHIQFLDISFNRISQITIHQQLSKLKTLNLNNNLLLRLQVGYQNNSITQLNISNNKLSVLGLGQLTQLQELNASSNQIVVVNLPSSIRRVILSSNLLKTSMFVSKLSHLSYLDLSYNQIKQLEFKRSEIKPELKYLDVSHNKIRIIDGLESIPNLECLNLSHNQLKLNFANQVLKLKHLKEFQCLGNEFDEALNQIQTTQNLLKNQLPIRTLRMFNRASNKSSNRSSRSHTFDKINHEKLSSKYQYQKPQSQEYRKRSNRSSTIFQLNRQDLNSNIKQSPFKLFVNQERSQPIQYTLGNPNPKIQRKLQMQTRNVSRSKRSLEKSREKHLNDQNEPQIKYFLQILNKYCMIPLKPILKVQKHITHKGQILEGIEYNLLKDLYRNQAMKFNKIYKITNIAELNKIQKAIGKNQKASSNQSLLFLHNSLNEQYVQRYLDSRISFNDVIKQCTEHLNLSKYPQKNSKNYVIKSTCRIEKSKFEKSQGSYLFTLIYLIY